MTPTTARAQEIAAFYARYASRLQRIVSAKVNAPAQTIEDACQSAWATLLRREDVTLDERGAAWLATVAIREGWRLTRRGEVPAAIDGLVAARARGRTGGQKPKLGPRQVMLARQMYDETGQDGKRKHTVVQIAAGSASAAPRSTATSPRHPDRSPRHQPRGTGAPDGTTPAADMLSGRWAANRDFFDVPDGPSPRPASSWRPRSCRLTVGLEQSPEGHQHTSDRLGRRALEGSASNRGRVSQPGFARLRKCGRAAPPPYTPTTAHRS